MSSNAAQTNRVRPLPRIKDVERIRVRVPFTERVAPWNAILVHQWQIVEVIRLTTDDPDLTGWGETVLHYTWGRVSEEAATSAIGRNPADLMGDDSLGAGLQMAVYDLVGKAMGVPVWRLFNMPAVREWCPLAWWNTCMMPEVLAEEAKEAVALGYTAHKFKARPWLDAVAQVEAISAVTPPHYRLDLDWNDMLLNVSSAAPVLQELEKYERVALFEGPIPQRDVEGYRELRRKISLPIAIHFGVPPFPTVVRDASCDGFVVSGGVNRVLRQGTLAAEFERPFFLQLVGTGLTTTMMSHFGAVLTQAQWPAITCLNNYSDDLIVDPITMVGGYMKVPDGPGLGITIDEEALSRFTMEPPYELPEPRHILSVVRPSGITRYAAMNAQLLAKLKKDRPHFAHENYAAADFAMSRMQCWEDHLAGNHPVQERGVRLEVWPDDGTPEWNDLYARAMRGPVREKV